MTSSTAQDCATGAKSPSHVEAEGEDADRAIQPGAQDMVHRVDEDRIRAHHHEAERSIGDSLSLRPPNRSQEHQQDPAGAVNREGGGADALDDRVPRVNQQPNRQAGTPIPDALILYAFDLVALQQAAGPHAEERGDGAGDEVERWSSNPGSCGRRSLGR